MTINEATRAYRLPNPTTLEDLESRFSGIDDKVLTFADKIVITGYYYNGPGQPCCHGAVYEWLGKTTPAKERSGCGQPVPQSFTMTATRRSGGSGGKEEIVNINAERPSVAK